ELRHISGASEYVGALTFCPEGKLWALGSHGMGVVLYEPATGKRIQQWPDGGIMPGALSRDGKLAVTVESNWVGKRVWGTTMGKELRQLGFSDFAGLPSAWSCVVLSADGKLLASCDVGLAKALSNVIHLFDPRTGKLLRRLPLDKHSPYAVSFAPDGKSMVV